MRKKRLNRIGNAVLEICFLILSTNTSALRVGVADPSESLTGTHWDLFGYVERGRGGVIGDEIKEVKGGL